MDVYESVGAVLAGTLSDSDLNELEHCAVPTLAPVPGKFTRTPWRWSRNTGFALTGGCDHAGRAFGS